MIEQVSELRIILKDAGHPISEYDVFWSACHDFFRGDHQRHITTHYNDYIQSGYVRVPSFVGQHAKDVRRGKKPLLAEKVSVLVA